MQWSQGTSLIAILVSFWALYYSRKKFLSEIAPELIVTEFDPIKTKITIENTGKGLAQNIESSEHIMLFSLGRNIRQWKLSFKKIAYLRSGASIDLVLEAHEDGQRAHATDLVAAANFPENRISYFYLTYQDKMGLKYYTRIAVGSSESSGHSTSRTLKALETGEREFWWNRMLRDVHGFMQGWKARRLLKSKIRQGQEKA